MHAQLRRRGTAFGTALAAVTALAALTGCGSDGDGHKDTAAASTGSPAPAATRPDTQAEPPSAEPSETPKAPVVPDSALKPATGSFTEKEKKYLSGRVPKDMDPAAVLQVGQEACERLTRTAKLDRDAALGALVTGEIDGADAAVDKLCPKQKPLLAAAAAGFPDGTRKNPAPGEYRALTAETGHCSWRAEGSGGRVLASGPGTGAKGPVKAKVPSGTERFVSEGCYAWAPSGS
ncbi:hypothetical protein [Streptomyces sp. NPDC058045]|uniref:hypothetical protein n=1 Tax=Streptomyces sp. NPDC058045 TaxID=3346311 RepID=UPI0036EA8A20